jgi:hypothetical protein
MTTPRRDFLQHIALGSLSAALIPDVAQAAWAERAGAASLEGGGMQSVDLSWTRRLTGKYKAVYDSPDIGGGLGVLRAGIVSAQYMAAFNVPASAISPVIVLRHDGIMLTMKQEYWDRYKIGEKYKVTHPWTGAPLTRSPALLGAGDGLPAGLENHALDKQLARGVIVLACALAFQDVVDTIATTDAIAPAAAATKARGLMLPGIIMQPSGVFATSVAQDNGCVYVRAT